MSKKNIVFIIGLLVLVGLAMSLNQPAPMVNFETGVAKTLELLGEENNLAKPNYSIPGISVEAGRDLVWNGIADHPKGGKTKLLSKHFVCVSCHNMKREDPDLRYHDPQARLLYVKKNGMPFLPGSSMYGAVNRTSFYNGDYEKKYGDLVRPARYDIRGAIQLCAVECSQGRPFEPWEIESIMAYFWTIELKLKDLSLTDADIIEINKTLAGNGDRRTWVEKIESLYLKGTPATFVAPPENRKTGYENVVGDPINGRLIYDLSCKYCHVSGRYAFFELDDSWFSFKFLEKHFPRYTRYSVYQVARYGTSPLEGKKAYMPNYTLEKLSHQQLEDLKAYVYLKSDGQSIPSAYDNQSAINGGN